MFFKLHRLIAVLNVAGLLLLVCNTYGQNQPDKSTNTGAIALNAYDEVKTYVNPILAGDHPDPTLLKVGDDFYMCGSSFHFVPNLPILHSRDLLHWETITRVIPPDWDMLKSGLPGNGIWQGAITYFYGTFHIYFSNGSGGGQYFSTAEKPSGPWSTPVKVKTTPTTGFIGYDNSIFVDDDGTPYMLIKPGQTTNRIQQIGRDGHLTGELINMDWINRDKHYSWAEGPVMCKRDGWYYYFMAGDVTGGQYALRSKTLTADSSKWETLGKVFAFSGDPQNRFRSSNHMSSPFILRDGTWWCMAQSYDAPVGDDWSGQGRQDILLQVEWDNNGKPFVPYPSDQPLARPHLENSGLLWCLPRSDYFNEGLVSPNWHFLNKNSSDACSLNEKKGWLTIDPGKAKAHILQKEGGRTYALVTHLSVDVNSPTEQAGIYLTSGNESVNVKLYSGFDNGKKVFFAMGKQIYSATNIAGEAVWLKLERNGHTLMGFYGSDGINWTQVGKLINAGNLDKVQPNYNSWVGTSIGLYAQGRKADFDLFIYKDGFSQLPLAGVNNFYGVTVSSKGTLTNMLQKGWSMLGGVEVGTPDKKARSLEIIANAEAGGEVEIWIDDLLNDGKKIATLTLTPTAPGSQGKTFSANIIPLTGQHDVYIKQGGSAKKILIQKLRFLPDVL